MTTIAVDGRPLGEAVVDLGRMRAALGALEIVARAIVDTSVSELRFGPDDLPLPAAVTVARDPIEDAVDVEVSVRSEPWSSPVPLRPWRFRLTRRDLIEAA